MVLIAGAGSFLVTSGSQSLWDLYVLPRIKSLPFQGLYANPFENNLTLKLTELNSQQLEHIPVNFFEYIKTNLWFIALGILFMKTIHAFYLPFFSLFVIGFIDIRKKIKKEPLIKYLLFLSILSFIFLYFWLLKTWILEKRYIAVFIFPSFIMVGLGIQSIVDYLKKKGWKEKPLLLALSILIIAITIPDNLEPKRKEKLAYKEIGEHIARENKNETVHIATSEGRIIFYANQYSKELICPRPLVNYDDLMHRKYSALVSLMREKKIQYLVWEETKRNKSSNDFLKESDNQDMVEIGIWSKKQNKLVLFKIIETK